MRACVREFLGQIGIHSRQHHPRQHHRRGTHPTWASFLAMKCFVNADAMAEPPSSSRMTCRVGCGGVGVSVVVHVDGSNLG